MNVNVMKDTAHRRKRGCSPHILRFLSLFVTIFIEFSLTKKKKRKKVLLLGRRINILCREKKFFKYGIMRLPEIPPKTMDIKEREHSIMLNNYIKKNNKNKVTFIFT